MYCSYTAVPARWLRPNTLRSLRHSSQVCPVICLLLASVLLAGCGEKIEEFGGPTMGSHYSLKYLAGEGSPEPAALKAEVEALLAQVDQQMSTWRSDSDLSEFNRLPAGSCRVMSDAVLTLVRAGEQLSRDSDGAFDLTVSPLLELWGFGPQSRGERVPTVDEVAAVQANVGHRHLSIEGQKLCKEAAVQLSLDSLGAGFSVDLIAARLNELGVSSYLLDITGEIKAAGVKPDGSAWRIAIEAPRDDQQVAQKVIALDGLGVSTSGDYRNYFEKEGRRYSHTLDPKTGAPITHRLASVTVIDPSAQRADGLSTLLMVLGPERGLAFADQHGIAAFFVVRQANGFITHSSRAFARQFDGGQP